jgi:SulP family sulfate permease
MPIASSAVLLVVAVAGFELIRYMPTMFVAATVFMFSIQMFMDWMYENVRKFGLVDYLIVCSILAIVMAFGMVEAILAGILLTGFMFILRYSMISAIQGKYSLDDHRSSVERSASSNRILNRHGGEGLVFTLRGFLFFGTTNLIRNTIKESIETGAYATILVDLRRVTGIDISALQTLQQIKQFCEANDTLLIYARVPEDAQDKLLSLDAVSRRDGEPLIFSETDFAMECMEEIILAKYAGKTTRGSVRDHLVDLMENEWKAELISGLMEKVEIGTGDQLFRQGDHDNGFYMVETGFLSASIDDGSGGSIRVKKFSPGSIIGELSIYTAEKKRTASVVADEPSVLHHLNPASLTGQSAETIAAQSAIHEMVARTLSTRIDYMNRRLMKEIL